MNDNPIITAWAEDMTITDKLNYLFHYHKVSKPVKIDDDDREMILIALNNCDICGVTVDDEGGLNIEYYGDT